MSKKMRYAVEKLKDVLIVLLTCSALWLAAQGYFQDTGRSSGALPAPPETGENRLPDSTGMARPLRIAANRVGENREGRCLVQFDQKAVDDLFQRTAGLLVEALSSAQPPEEVDRETWEKALTELPGLTFDFRGEVPIPVLMGWLTGGTTPVTGTVSTVTLAVEGEDVMLYYREEERDACFASLTRAVNRTHLEEALASLSDNGAYYAFQTDWGEDLDPDALFQPNIPPLPVYGARNPVSAGGADMEALLSRLGIPLNTTSFYASGDELVARNGTDMFRLSELGSIHYENDGAPSGRFPVLPLQNADRLTETVEACRSLTAATLLPTAGEARLFLASVQEQEDGVEVAFDYALNGMPVVLSSGHAARFLVRNGAILRFDLQFRSYADSGVTVPVMPPRQATAALEAEAEGREELLLICSDSLGDTVYPGWGAARTEED